MMDGEPPYTDSAQDDGDTDKEPVDPAIIQRALDRVKSVAAGNGIDPETITLVNFEGEVLHFEARSLFTVKPTVAEKSMPGKEQGEVCGSASDLQIKITTAIEKTTVNPDIIGYISDVLERRADKGFMIDHLVVKLERLAKKFVYFNSCTSCAGGKMLCATCHGAGNSNCPKCHAHRTIVCPMCRGTKVSRQKDGSMGTCRKCNGHGEAPCTACRAQGKIKCMPCQGTGRVQCPKCTGTGIISEIAFVSFEAETAFAYDADILPPEVPPLIDQLGPVMAVKQHADIQILKENDQRFIQREYEVAEKVRVRDGMIVPYYVRLPWGEIEFALGETNLAGKLFGLHPRLLNLPPFLEGPLGPGLDRLTQAANNLGNVRANVTEAIGFRAIGDALIAAATMPPKKASQAIRGRWALGLRPDVAHKMVQLADKAVQNLTRKARIFGLVAGLVLTAGFYALYLIGPLRVMAAGQGLHPYALIALDAMLVVTAGYAAMLLSQLATRRALSSMFEKIVPAEKARKIIPRAGQSGMIAFAGSAFIFAAMLVVTALTGHELPAWAATLL